ncbi:NAD(P)-binding domain-containing protein [Dactylosporangium sp. NPDC000555]|uniref:imine reductase family protein n=1 Tax=Dactylosporangium sp. NPDC000555 TaxID=3154260 RepID=UPI00331F5AB2
MNDEPCAVAVLGLGPMGRALAGAALAAGHATVVWNRTPQRAHPLLDRGAALAPSAAEALRRAPVAICCLLDYGAVRSALDGAEGPAVLVNLGSGHSGEVRGMAGWAAARGIEYLDGAILTPAPTIGTPAATILYSGPRPIFDAHQAVLRAFAADPLFLGEEVTTAAAYEMALLDLFVMSTGGLAHAFALATAAGLDPAAFARFAGGIGALLPEMAHRYAGNLAAGTFPGQPSTLGSASAALAHVAAASADLGVDAGPLHALRALFDRAVVAGHGGEGYARLARFLTDERTHR